MKEFEKYGLTPGDFMYLPWRKLSHLSSLKNEVGSCAREEIIFRSDANFRRGLGELSNEEVIEGSNSQEEAESRIRDEELFRADYRMRIAFGGSFDIGKPNKRDC